MGKTKRGNNEGEEVYSVDSRLLESHQGLGQVDQKKQKARMVAVGKPRNC